MNSRSPTLSELQHAMRQNMLTGDDGDLADWIVGAGADASMRLGIYRNTSSSVMVTALRLVFPVVLHLVGEEFFEAASRHFALQAPPHSAWLDEYGDGFPAFLAHWPHAARVPYLSDVARLEWQVAQSLHAPATPSLDLDRLATLSETQLAEVRLVPRADVRLLRCEFPADAIWRAVLEQDDDAMAAIDLDDAPVWLRVSRTECGPEVVRLGEFEWQLMRTLFAGRPLRDALVEAQSQESYALLATQLASGCFSDIDLDGTVAMPSTTE